MANSKVYCTPAGGAMNAPIKLSQNQNRSYSFQFSSDVISGTYFSASLYVSVYPTLGLLGGTYLVNGQSLYSHGSSFNISSGFSQTYTIPSGQKYLRIECTDAIIGEGWVSGSGFDYWYEIPDPIVLNPPGIPSISQSGSNYILSWTAASLSTGGSAGITYTVVYGNEGETYQAGGSTSATIPIPQAYYEQNIRFRVYAHYSGIPSVVSGDAYFIAHRTSVTAPTNVTIVQNTLKTYTISWNPSYGSYGNPNDKITYTIWNVSDGSPLVQGLSNTSAVLNISVYNVRLEFRIYAYYGSASSQSPNVAYTFIQPTITKQPEIISINPQQGKQTTITWSAAQVSNQFDTSIYYQYFIGPNSIYSDNYHIGTTDKLSAAITEENIISKCGEGEKTCYLFVRAYWIKDDISGGWIVPTGKPFYYVPDTGALMYYDGLNWIQCNVYYYDGTQWKECIPYIYNGSTWIEGGQL